MSATLRHKESMEVKTGRMEVDTVVVSDDSTGLHRAEKTDTVVYVHYYHEGNQQIKKNLSLMK